MKDDEKPVPILRVDGEGCIVEFDDAAAELFGIARAGALGRPLAEVAREAIESVRASRAAAVKELEAFTHAVSHDLRAPVRHVQGFVALLESEQKDKFEGEALHFLDVIGKSARKLNAMIEGLLAHSRAARVELRSSELDMEQIVRDAVASAGRRVPERRIAWEVGPLAPAQGDRALIRQVWDILIDNAVKFTKDVPEAHVTLGCRDAEGGVEYYVRDDGAGLQMEYAAKLFTLFQRVHHENEFEGLGVGLAVARRIVARHGGTMRLEGKSGAGACASFTLPRTSAEGTVRSASG